MNQTFSIQIGNFEGPLDLLLQLIEKRKLHISDISLSKVTDDYVQFLQYSDSIPKKDMAEFLVVASTLMVIKSESLIPGSRTTTPEEETTEDLKKRLYLYQYLKGLAENLKPLFNRRQMFFRPFKNKLVISFNPSSDITQANLHSAIKNLIHTLPVTNHNPEVAIKKVISLHEVMDNLMTKLQNSLSIKFNQKNPVDKIEKINIIMTFIGLLELVKNGLIKVNQNEHFSDMDINKDSDLT
ncbi:MAG: ScpA family protein [Candidatus Paceibacterota bacterium]